MRVMGIDPGYAIVGWGVVEYSGNRFAPVGYGAVMTDKDTPFERRLAEIYDGITDILRRYARRQSRWKSSITSTTRPPSSGWPKPAA